MNNEKQTEFDVLLQNNSVLHVILGNTYSAIGTSGITDGKSVTGKLVNIDKYGAYIECSKGVIHLCNKRTLNISINN